MRTNRRPRPRAVQISLLAVLVALVAAPAGRADTGTPPSIDSLTIDNHSPFYGDTLTVSDTVSGDGPFTRHYSWQMCFDAVGGTCFSAGSDSPQYVVGQGDVFRYIRVTEMLTGAYGSATASDTTNLVRGLPVNVSLVGTVDVASPLAVGLAGVPVHYTFTATNTAATTALNTEIDVFDLETMQDVTSTCTADGGSACHGGFYSSGFLSRSVDVAQGHPVTIDVHGVLAYGTAGPLSPFADMSVDSRYDNSSFLDF